MHATITIEWYDFAALWILFLGVIFAWVTIAVYRVEVDVAAARYHTVPNPHPADGARRFGN